MRRKKLVWLLYPAFLLIILLCLFPLIWIMAGVDKKHYFQVTAQHLKAQTYLVEQCLEPYLIPAQPKELEQQCQSLAKNIGARITLVLPDGQVLADSNENPSRMENHADRQEIQAALQGQPFVIQRHSYTLREDLIYAAIPHYRGDKITAVIRLSITKASFVHTLKEIYLEVFIYLGLIAILAIFLSWLISRSLSRPLEKMQACARTFALGDFRHPIPHSQILEINSLAESLNEMGRTLDAYLQEIVHQRNEREAILASMEEGVLAIDAAETLVTLNRFAADLFGIELEKTKGQNYRAIIRHPELQQMIQQALDTAEPVQGEITLYAEAERAILVRGTRWIDDQGQSLGAVFVLNDISRIKLLEKVRRDFVANVSHELKTPITLIQGFVETLLDGAMKKSGETKKFLATILEHAQRLHSLIEDLLSLSKIEQMEKMVLPKETVRLKDLLLQALANRESMARDKKIMIAHHCPEDLELALNPHLMEQAIVNLLDNAIKYSQAGSQIELSGMRLENEIMIRVKDSGCGIAAEHLQRIFERFYRVDRSRSRQEGGTGLGLAIVKHIAQAHGGRVEVESIPGRGSLFTIALPSANPN